jgi:FKBP-type peptidyl-prolyl cis-trans isomerase
MNIKRNYGITLFIYFMGLLLVGCTEDKYKDWQLLNEQWLAKNLKNDSIQQTSTGLQYKIIYQGDPNMRKPNQNSIVTISYKGELINGTVFDNGNNITFRLSNLIKGWQEGIVKMNGGGTYILYIPSNLAYDKDGSLPGIPPHSTLKFTVTLIDSQN